MRKLVFSFAAALAAFSAFADFPFSDFGAKAAAYFTDQNIPSPKALNYADAGELKAKLTALDADGKTITTEFTIDKSDVEGSISAALEGLRSTVNTATINAARALAQAAALAEMVYDNAEAIEQILTALYRIFTDLATLEIRNPEDNTAEKIPMKVEGDTVYITHDFGKPVAVDGLSITSNSQNRIQVGDFEIADINTIPVKRELSGELSFTFLPNIMDIGLFDFIDEINHYTTIKGFYDDHAAGGSFGFCADSLAQQLTRQADDHSHFMLSVYFDGANHHLHYTPVGVLTNLAAATDSPWSWDAQNKTFRNPWVQVGYSTVQAAGVGMNLADGSYHVAVDMEAGTATFETGVAPTSSDNMAYFNVGTVSGGKLTDGIKSMPVCIYWQ